MWFHESTIYQIYPLGLCGAPSQNDGVLQHRLLRLLEFIEHIKKTGADTVLLNPLFDSDCHGYDTRDYYKVDCRLGTKEDLQTVCQALHQAGLRVILDGVFGHVGRGFWAFRDVQEKKWDSAYRDWFHLRFDGDTGYHDGFYYEAWEGHYELVKLNLHNPQVVQHQFDAIASWVADYDIDGLRLDVAYCLPEDYLKALRRFTEGLKQDFVLIGETIHGDYRRLMNGEMCHSVTNYECYKGLYSSFNSMNLFEIGHSLARQFGPEPWTLYKGQHLLNFLDNHDVTRISSILQDSRHLVPAYGLLFAMPGVPALYYGSEWGLSGDKRDGDAALRPEIARPQENALTAWIAKLAAARRKSPALLYGTYRNAHLTNRQLVLERRTEGERVLAAINADANTYTAYFDIGASRATNLLDGKRRELHEKIEMPPFSAAYFRVEE